MEESQGNCSLVGIGGAGTTVVQQIHKRSMQQDYYAIDVDSSRFSQGDDACNLKLGDFEWPSGEIEKLQTRITEEMILRYVAGNRSRLDEFIRQIPGNVLILGGMAGLTWRVLSPIVIAEAKSGGRIVHLYGWLPFSFEGGSRRRRALDCLRECSGIADNVVVQNNDGISVRNHDLNLRQLYSFVDELTIVRIAGYNQIERLYE